MENIDSTNRDTLSNNARSITYFTTSHILYKLMWHAATSTINH